MVEQIVANILSLALVLAVSAFLFKRWMDRVDNTLKTVCESMETKVNKIDCKDRMRQEDSGSKEIWDWLKYHEHTESGAVIVPRR